MKRRAQDPWNFLFIAGMWFQDLFNYDFPPHRNVHHPLRHAAGRNQLFARTTPAWAGATSSKNMHKNATRRRVVQESRQARDLRQGQERQPSAPTSTRSFIDADDAFARSAPGARHSPDRLPKRTAFAARWLSRSRPGFAPIYEELVLKKPQTAVVQIGTVSDIAKAVPAKLHQRREAHRHRSGQWQRERSPQVQGSRRRSRSRRLIPLVAQAFRPEAFSNRDRKPQNGPDQSGAVFFFAFLSGHVLVTSACDSTSMFGRSLFHVQKHQDALQL